MFRYESTPLLFHAVLQTMATKSKYNYIDEPGDKLKCCLCLAVARDPLQEGNCGKLFCIRCVKKHGEGKPCAHCNKQPKYFRDMKSHQDIQEIPVKCKRVEKGCTWTGTIGTLEDHLTKTCDFTKVLCKYKDIGCTKKVIRKGIKEHEKKRTAVHLELAYANIKKIEESIVAMKILKNNSITFRLEEYKVRKENSHAHIEVFYTSPGGYQMDLLVGYNGVADGEGTHLSVATSVLKKPSYSEFLKGTIKIELLNQLRDGNHFGRSIGLNYVDEIDAQIGTDFKFIPHSSLLYNEASHTQYLLNDTLYIRVTVTVDNHRPWLEHV